MTVHANGKPEVLSVKGLYPVEGKPDNIRACWACMSRPPLKGEYYLSGAVIMAYQAKADMTEPYPLAKLVEVERVTVLKIKRFL